MLENLLLEEDTVRFYAVLMINFFGLLGIIIFSVFEAKGNVLGAFIAFVITVGLIFSIAFATKYWL